MPTDPAQLDEAPESVLRAALSRIVKLPAAGFDKGHGSEASRIAREALTVAPAAAHHPRRDDDVAQWLTRMRDAWSQDGECSESRAIDSLLDRYRECAELGLTLAAEHDEAGNL
ncbi:MAG: hypothetical protein LC798_12165 [Chloroflexi bacterium]|nr:hypothetical protein [Chloroflexota bacterium]